LATGLGAAALGFAAGGVYFGLRADEAGDQNTKVFARGLRWDPSAHDRESIGLRDQALAITLVGVAVAAGATAIWLWAYD
jgi:hypothetical protein